MKERLFKIMPSLIYVGKVRPQRPSISQEDETDLLFFARSGCSVKINDAVLTPKSGDLMIVSGSMEYEVDIKDLPLGTVTFLSIGGGKLYSKDSLCSETGYRLLSTGKQRGIMETTLRQLLRETENRTPTSSILSSSLTDTVMTLTARLLPNEPVPRKTSQIFEIAKKYFDEHYLEDETIVQACEKLGVDRYRLTHIFSGEMGMPPVKYLISKRMDLAKRLLETTDADVGKIAKECGYPDTTYFCRIFKQTQGKTALSYRYEYKQSLAAAEKETAATLSSPPRK